MADKRCATCDVVKSINDFPQNGNGRTRPDCKICRNTENRQNWPKYREVTTKTRRDDYLVRRYKMTLEDYDLLLIQQNDGCAICGTTESGGRGRFHVDHDHACCPGVETCGQCIRGLLCNKCNIGISNFRDNVVVMARAIEYLRGGSDS